MEIKVGTNQDVEIIEEDDGTRTVRITDITGSRVSSLRTGDTFRMANHEWIVLDARLKTDYGYGVGVISKDFYSIMNFGISKDFDESNVRRYFYDVVLRQIEFDIDGKIIPTIADSNSLDGKNEYIYWSSYIRLLTYDEARKYNEILVNEDLECAWWTCTPWSTTERGCDYDMVIIHPSGLISIGHCKQEECGIRPFCVLEPNTIVHPIT